MGTTGNLGLGDVHKLINDGPVHLDAISGCFGVPSENPGQHALNEAFANYLKPAFAAAERAMNIDTSKALSEANIRTPGLVLS